MKKLFIFLLIAFFQQITTFGQDLLVTEKGDSLNCKITKIKNDYVYFTFSHEGEVRNTLLLKTQVKYYQYNYYVKPEVLPHQMTSYKPEYPHWRLAFNGGWSYRLASLPDGLSSAEKEYLKKLKSGFSISCDVTYFFMEALGVGLKYDLYKSSNSLSGLSDNISIPFIGPAFATRVFNQDKTNYWFFNLAFGYMGFKDKGTASGQSGTIKGGTAGVAMDIGYDFAISKNWAAGVQVSLLSGMITELDYTINGTTQKKKLEKDQYEGLGRMNISVGLRCNL